jgi:maleylpyruvate isomerase
MSDATMPDATVPDATMPDATSPGTAEALLPEATRRLIRTTDALDDAEHAAPSLLPGWTRAHVLAHLALNAEALAAALQGLAEGEDVPMYRSDDARDSDIESLAAEEPSVLRARLLAACTDLSDALAAVPDDRRTARIERTPGGRAFVAGDVPGMRLREVEIHHADLGAGYDRASWPTDFSAYVVTSLRRRGSEAGGFRARATDTGQEWDFGAETPTVHGSVADLAWWLTGRGEGEGLTVEGGTLPRMEAW